MKKTKQLNKKDFMEKNYITCPECSYNNERGRFNQFGTCLKCGAILDQKVYFMIEMMKVAKDNKRKRG